MKHAHRAVCLTALLCLNGAALLKAAGLKGEYFNNTGLVGTPIAARIDPTVDFAWAAAPMDGVSANYFSARWTGQVEAPATGPVTFATFSNNGVRLWLDNVLIIDDWAAHSTKRNASTPRTLTAGQKYTVKLEFYGNTSTAVARLLWSYPGQAEIVIPQTKLTSTVADALPKPVYLSDLNPGFVDNGWGPYSRDRSNGETGRFDGDVISLSGVLFEKGLGVHARSELHYVLGGKYKSFSSKIGIDDEVGGRGSVVFQVWADGAKLFESDVLHGADKIAIVTADLTGKNELKLIVLDGGNGNGYDHADWADAYLSTAAASGIPNPPLPPPPPVPQPPPAVTGLTATPGNQQVMLAWNAITGATYNVYRRTSSVAEAAVGMGVTVPSFTDSGLTNNTTYIYRVAAVVGGLTGAKSADASAKPVPPPPPAVPTGLSAIPGNGQITLSWNSVSGATSYNLYRGTAANGESATALMTGISTLTFTDTSLTNGTTYFYKLAAVSSAGIGSKSSEANAMPTAPGLLLTNAQKDAFRFLRQSTWGPNPGLVDHVVQVGKAAFIDEQVVATPSDYPADLITKPNMELVSERFFQNGIQGEDQLRQRVAWALSEIFVVSAVKVDNTHAMVPYIKMLHAHAFDNVKDIMHDVSLSPAMGEFLDMVNNQKADPVKGTLPNENYAREWLQLMSIGLQELGDDGSPVLDSKGVPIPTYVQSDIADLARVLTGWTYGDTKTTNPTRLNSPFYDGPMKPVDKLHDAGQKTVLGNVFPAGQTGQQDFDQALNMIFNHHNVGPFLVRELIQRLVTSNPSKTYIRDVVGVFNNNGQGVRGDLKAVVKAILLHPEAVNGTPTSGKFSEPALFLLTLTRALDAKVVDHPFMTDFSQDMSQQIWFAPSIFNYFSPNYRAGNLFAPEMQIWTTATAMSRTNFVASLISGGFGSDVTINIAPFNSAAPDPNALVDTVNALIMGGTMGSEMRQAILTALGATKNTSERVRTALYLAATSMQYQVEH